MKKIKRAKRVRHNAVRLKPAPMPTELQRWQDQRAKLQAWRERVAAAQSMHGEKWKLAQLAHIDTLIQTHEANKPKSE